MAKKVNLEHQPRKASSVIKTSIVSVIFILYMFPFLLVLVNSLKRKVNIENTDILEYDDLKLDIRTGKMSANGNEISINGKELDLLETLLLNKTQIVNREILANKIWGYDSEAEYNNVEVYMSFLRKKLKLIKSNVKIKAIRGIGYKLEAENDKKIK